jgi:hypothetical protein
MQDVDLAPLHPDEPALHRELRDALNREIATTSFFVWINVMPTGSAQTFNDLSRLVNGIQLWLDTLDPDAVSETQDVPELVVPDPAAEVRVRALPKKVSARGQRSEHIVGNPESVLVGWTAA